MTYVNSEHDVLDSDFPYLLEVLDLRGLYLDEDYDADDGFYVETYELSVLPFIETALATLTPSERAAIAEADSTADVPTFLKEKMQNNLTLYTAFLFILACEF